MRTKSKPLSFARAKFLIDDKSVLGRTFFVKANTEELKSIAETLGLVEVKFLEAQLLVVGLQASGFEVKGTYTANFMQTCVVTLEPFEGVIEGDVQETYVPFNGVSNLMDIDNSTLGDGEPITDGEVHLGKLIIDVLSLDLDPYPRLPNSNDQKFELGREAETLKEQKSPFDQLDSFRKSMSDSL